LRLINAIDRLDDGRHKSRGTFSGIMLHRCGVDKKWGNCLGYNGIDVAEAFLGREERWSTVAQITGYQNAYTFLIGGDSLDPEGDDGTIWQCLPLSEVGNHARRFSGQYLGIGLIGDFRFDEPTPKQMGAAIELCTLLCRSYDLDPYKAIAGHGEVTGAHDGSKSLGEPNACPGDKLDMYCFRDDVAQCIKYESRALLDGLGIIA